MPRTESPAAEAARAKEARIAQLTTNITRDLLHGDGRIGGRMRLRKDATTGRVETTTEQTARLIKELEARDNHPLLKATLAFTQEVLPQEHFKREDKETPYINHALRTTLLLQDLLDPSLSRDERAVRLSIMLAHDSIEEPHERFITKPVDEDGNLKKGGLSHTILKGLFDTFMEEVSKEKPELVEQVDNGIEAFNKYRPDDTRKPDKEITDEYFSELARLELMGEKVVDRGMDSPMGDMSRIARFLEEGLQDPERMPEIRYITLPKLFARLTRSVDKARALKELTKRLPKDKRVPDAIEEYFEATIRTGDHFIDAVNNRLREEASRHAPILLFREPVFAA